MTILLRSLAALLLFAQLSVAVAQSASQATLNLKDADINTLISTVSEITGKNFIIDPRVKGKVTVLSSTPMSADGVYETFLAVLQVHGFAAIPAGEAIKIIPEVNAKQDGAPTRGPQTLAPDDVVTKVFTIDNVPAAQLVPILRPLVPQYGHLAAYAPSNMLIISDRVANVERLRAIIRQIDTSSDREFELIRMTHASAADIAQTLTTLTQQDRKTDPNTTPVTILADERTNALLIGGDKATRSQFRSIIAELDLPLEDSGSTQVIYLRYASAENLGPVLQGYVEQVAASEGGGQNNQARTSASVVKVIPEPDTNALVITAPPKIMRAVKDVVAQLDIRRAQVLVEAIIAEVSESKSRELGIDSVLFDEDRIAAANILDPGTLNALTSVAGAATGSITGAAAAALIEQGITLAGGRYNENGTSFLFLLKALAGDGNTNILSTPTLVTMDNEEAEISVGQEVPFLSGQYSNSGTTSSTGLVNPFQTIDRKDVGITLGITPQINEGDTIQLKISQEVSAVSAGSAGAVDLVTNKRSLTTTVMVDSGDILVLGGLIDDQVQETERRTPILGSIPILGNLFKFRSVSKDRRNLMIFIRPVVLRDRETANYYTRQKYDSIRTTQLGSQTGGISILGGAKRPLLEELDAVESQPRGGRESGPAQVNPSVPKSYPRTPTGEAVDDSEHDKQPVVTPPTDDADEDKKSSRTFDKTKPGNTARRAHWPK
jgi:general secretion pathway protein D